MIDTGTARISRYNPRSKLLELPISEVSQAAAKQRAGRCGREAPGVCVRLYSEENFLSREEFTAPEILRTSLATSILRCAVLKLGHLGDFPLPDMPSERLIKDGLNLLKEINALDRHQKITPIGRQLAKLPIDPRLGRFLLAATEVGQYEFALTICSAISVGDCRLRPVEHRQLADEAHAEFHHSDSDLLSYVNLWKVLENKLETQSRNEVNKYCKKKFLSVVRVKQWQDLRRQLHRQCVDLGLPTDSVGLNYKKLHQAFLVGFASLIGSKDQKGDYRGGHGVKFKIHPRSAIKERKPKYIACLERFETSSRFADVVAKIEPGWVIKAAPHLIKSSYSSPYWDRKRGKAYAFETRRLFGLALGGDKRVPYTAIDMRHSRTLLIEHGLVRFELEKLPDFLQDNQRTLGDIRRLEQKVRRQLIPGDHELCDFYASVLPENVATINSLEKWTREDQGRSHELVYQADQEIRDLQQRASVQFPDTVVFGEYEFKVKYLFDPLHKQDGMTVVVEKTILQRLSLTTFEALVPGLLHEKVVALAKSLPKSERKKISPVGEFANEVVERVGTESLETVFRRHFFERSGDALAPGFASSLSLPTYLTAHVEVVEEAHTLERPAAGDAVSESQGRFYADLASARKGENGGEADDNLRQERPVFNRWQIDELSYREETRVGKNRIIDYLAFVDVGEGVTVGRFAQSEVAEMMHRHGVARLASLASGIGSRKSVLPGFDRREILLMCSSLGLNTADLLEIRKAAYLSLLTEHESPRSMRAFDDFMSAHAAEAEKATEEMCLKLAELVAEAYRVQRLLSAQLAHRWPAVYQDIIGQIHYLFSAQAFGILDKKTMHDYQRYLTGMQRRVERLILNPSKDVQKALIVAPIVTAWTRACEQSGSLAPDVFKLYFDVEEVRLKQFAPELATSRKINLRALANEISARAKVTSIGP